MEKNGGGGEEDKHEVGTGEEKRKTIKIINPKKSLKNHEKTMRSA